MSEQLVYDPVSPEAHADPYPIYARLRDEAPIYFVEPHNVWALSRYADVQGALRDWEVFSSAQGVELGEYVQFFGEGSIQELDPPHHDVIRKILAPRFTSRRIKEYEPMVLESAEELLNEISTGEVDLGLHYTQRLPMLTILRILGIPEKDIPWTITTGLEMLRRPPGESGPSAKAAELRTELVSFMEDLVTHRRSGNMSDDVLGDIAQGIDAGLMKTSEIQGLTLLLIAAGMETTTSLIGNITHSVAVGQVSADQLLNENGQLPQTAITEYLRLDAPGQWLSRVTTQPVSMHGVDLPTGSRVLTIFASANRDPREFDHADELRFDRDGSRNLAFGEGVHFCLGMSLARLETRVGISALLQRYPELTLAGSPTRYQSHVIRGYESIPVKL
jgi:cytochrome P450